MKPMIKIIIHVLVIEFFMGRIIVKIYYSHTYIVAEDPTLTFKISELTAVKR